VPDKSKAELMGEAFEAEAKLRYDASGEAVNSPTNSDRDTAESGHTEQAIWGSAVPADPAGAALSVEFPEIKTGDSIAIEGQTYKWNGASYSLPVNTPKE